MTRDSSHFFISPILADHEQMVSMGAKLITVDPLQDRIADTGLNLPDSCMFFDTTTATTLSRLSKTMGHVIGQKCLAH